ncbi:hypothetical protein [Kineococcus sp. SYSU DK005]|uniref:hypothetical protein n=1 Tax=Kineococcus sp. SYSU DK005 TaxID=3383126 RepID=UPI003D7E0BA8
MMDPLPALQDLARLFESEPLYPFGIQDAPWPYVCVRFTLTRGASRVQLQVEPASDLVRLVLHAAGEELVHLQLHAVRSLRAERAAGRELLGIAFDERLPVDGLWLRTRPSLSLTWRAGAGQ